MTKQALYTINVSGAGRLELSTPRNPALTHRGGNTVGHMVLSEAEALEIKQMPLPSGLELTIEIMPGQTQEQYEERVGLLDGQKMIWPCSKCPGCPWVDPLVPSLCGLVDWPKESVGVLLEGQPGYVDARDACPVRRRGHPPRQEV